jgi:hypothetical protein
MSLIQMKQADFIQVFLPYVWDESKRQSYYESIKGAGYRALLPERSGAEASGRERYGSPTAPG